MNTQRQGILTDCETKQSQKGNIYHRMDIKEHGADRAQWYTYFGNLDASHRGQEIRYVLKESRDGTPIVDAYELAEPGMAPPTVTTPALTPETMGPKYGMSSPAGAAPNRHGGSKDMWICTESIFQHAIASMETSADGTMSLDDVQELALHSARCAILINSAFRVHDKEGSTKALAFLRKALPGEPAALASDLAARAQESVPPPRVDIVPPAPGWQPAPAPTPPAPPTPEAPPVEAYDDIPGFDNDDIPF